MKEGRTNKLTFFWTRIFIGDFWEIPSGFPPKKTLSWNRDKNNEIPKNSDWCSVCSFTSRFLFFFFSFCSSDAKGGRDQSKQTENAQQATTRTSEDDAWVLHHKMNKIKWRGVCIVKKQKQKNKKKGQKKQIIFTFLLISCFGHFCFVC